MPDPLLTLLLFVCLAIMPTYLDQFGHDRAEFELRKSVYAKGWQRWMMVNRNAGRYGSIALLFVIWMVLATNYAKFHPTLSVLLYVIAAASILSFVAFQILTDTFCR